MSTTLFFTSPQFLQGFLKNDHSRKLLLLANTLNESPTGIAAVISPIPSNTESTSFNGHVLMILSALICGVICSIGLHYIIRGVSTLLIYERSASVSPVIKKGVPQKVLKTLPIMSYTAELKFPGLDTECVLCLSEFETGEQLRILPKCNHGFHVPCIDTWLKLNSSCPKCRHCLEETCHDILEAQEIIVVRIEPVTR